ncbi:unnamed protein product [Closterium sp. NIES-64]|nr:unnamed protein product [Closterium sp. NIES-64]
MEAVEHLNAHGLPVISRARTEVSLVRTQAELRLRAENEDLQSTLKLTQERALDLQIALDEKEAAYVALNKKALEAFTFMTTAAPAWRMKFYPLWPELREMMAEKYAEAGVGKDIFYYVICMFPGQENLAMRKASERRSNYNGNIKTYGRGPGGCVPESKWKELADEGVAPKCSRSPSEWTLFYLHAPAAPSSRTAGQLSRPTTRPPSRPSIEPPNSRAAQQPSRLTAELPSTVQPSCPAAEPPTTRAAQQPSRPSSRAARQPSCRAARSPHLPVDFEVWVDDLQLFLQCNRADGLSLFDLNSGASPAPAADADATLPDSLRVVRDHFLSICPTTLTVDLLEKALLAIEKSIVAVGASCGDPRTPVFEGCSPSPLLPSLASAAAADLVGFESVGAASAPSGRHRTSKGKGGKGTGEKI